MRRGLTIDFNRNIIRSMTERSRLNAQRVNRERRARRAEEELSQQELDPATLKRVDDFDRAIQEVLGPDIADTAFGREAREIGRRIAPHFED